MAKVLIIGTGPLLSESVKMIGGQCLRTWHFTKPIISAGHECRLITIPIPDRTKTPPILEEEKGLNEHIYRNFIYREFNNADKFFIIQKLNEEIRQFNPDCLIGVNTFPSYIVCSLDCAKPIWCDLNGWEMGEAQIKAHLMDDDSCLEWGIEQERGVLLRCDRLSVVSAPQVFASLGELAWCGRLNKHTFNYPFMLEIPNAVNEEFLDLDEEELLAKTNVKRDESAFIVLWSGGFNTWTDVDMLYSALCFAMEKNPRIYFVSTGGAIDGHDERTYARFQALVNESQYRDSFHLMGWVNTEEMLAWHLQADIGINIDTWNYETMFGARNRITNMMAVGLTVVTTFGTEISSVIKQNELGYVTPIGDAQKLSDAIVELSHDPQMAKAIGNRAREYALDNFSYERTTAALIEWLESPTLAPDNEIRKDTLGHYAKDIDSSLNELHKQTLALEHFGFNSLLEAKIDIDAIRAKPLYKVCQKIKSFFRGNSSTEK